MAKKKISKAEPEPAVAAFTPTGKLTREHLEGYRWAAADILRESTPSSR